MNDRRALSRPRNRPHPRRPAPRLLRCALLIVTGAIVLNALVGERGLFATLTAGRQSAELTVRITDLRQENESLRDEVRRLREEPTAIEEIARRELGLLRRGERLFIMSDPDRTE